MAPNRKQVTTLLASPADLAHLANSIQPKFLPLTHPKEEQEHVTRQQEPVKSEQPMASYWDWPADTPQEETKKDLFSVDHLVSNLIQASNNIPTESSTSSANDDYWAEESSASEVPKPMASKPQHLTASYWDWETTTSEEKNQATIDMIVQEDKAHRIVSASLRVQPSSGPEQPQQVHSTKTSNDQYWSWESPITASHVGDIHHPHANYWDEATENDKSMIQQLKEYERARQMLSADHVVELLKQQQQYAGTSGSVAKASSEDYWSWSEPMGDAYWDMTPAPAVSCGGGAGYWDM